MSVIAIVIDLASEGHTTTSLGTLGEAMLMLSAFPAILACLLREIKIKRDELLSAQKRRISIGVIVNVYRG